MLARVDQINLTNRLLDLAATLKPSVSLRSLDAIHLAAALSIGADLRSVLTYDPRMQSAASALGMVIQAPA